MKDGRAEGFNPQHLNARIWVVFRDVVERAKSEVPGHGASDFSVTIDATSVRGERNGLPFFLGLQDQHHEGKRCRDARGGIINLLVRRLQFADF
ncbi:hypothetical protein [Cupriavidus sp. TMH.W2]|uniref:hypothetical protein n=1 Tax=Cupriavidus sp. TMH.W2 TaxID=3434465 RepID=UPI003D76C2B7